MPTSVLLNVTSDTERFVAMFDVRDCMVSSSSDPVCDMHLLDAHVKKKPPLTNFFGCDVHSVHCKV